MTTEIGNGPALNKPTATVDWREVARFACLKVDWNAVAKTALGSATLASLVGGAIQMIGKAIEMELCAIHDATHKSAEPKAPIVEDRSDAEQAESEAEFDAESDVEADDRRVVDDDAAKAAVLLGVCEDASEDEIRAALRALLSSSRLHPDHGGDGEEATRLIAAKNLLISRARAVRP